MMLKTSSRKINPFFGMFKTTFSKNAGLIILLSVGVLLLCPGYLVTLLNGNYTDSPVSLFYEMSKTIIYILAAVGVGSVLLFNFINFNFLYKKSSADVFHALPLTRSELLISRSLSGVIFSLIPVTIGYIAIIVLNCIYNEPLTLAHIGLTYLYTLTFMLVTSAFSVIFVICAGSSFDLILSFGAFNLSLIFVGLILMLIFEEFLKGYHYWGDTMEVLSYFSPFIFFANRFSIIANERYISGEIATFFIVSAILIFGLFALSLALFNRRKAEKGGEAYAFKFAGILCTVLISICGGYLLGMMFSAGEMASVLFWIFAILGGVIAGVIYGAVSGRGFKNLKSSVISGLASTVITAIAVIITVSGGFGFATRVPNPEAVETAVLRINGEDITFENPDFPISVHKEILSGKVEEGDNEDWENWHYISIDYTLKDGSEMTRAYSFYDEEHPNLLKKIATCEERYTSIKNNLKNNIQSTVDVLWENEDYCNTYITNAEYAELLNIFETEVENAKHNGLEGWFSDGDDYYSFTFSDYEGGYHSFDITVDQSVPKTKAYLESLDLLTRSEEVIFTESK